MGKRITAFFLLLVSLFLFACSDKLTSNQIEHSVMSENDLIMKAVYEMKEMKCDRVFVQFEEIEKEGEEKRNALVFYEKKNEDHIEFENEILEEILKKLGLFLIFFQTDSEGRQCVIFSYSEETSKTIMKGFYYSFDGLPFAFWGRNGKLKKDHGRFIELNNETNAWYSTNLIENNIYYYEKKGTL